MGQQIGQFLLQLHTFDLKGAPICTMQDEVLQFQNHYQTASPVIASRFSSDEHTKLKKLIYDQMPATISKFGSDLVLCHGDLAYWNLILTDHNKVGAIDFGDIGYYDKSKDFLGMEDKQLLDSTLLVYGDNEILREKITIRRKVLPLLDLTYFIENKNEQMTITTLEKIRVIL